MQIDSHFVENPVEARIQCLKNMAELLEAEGVSGSVAELGVYRGEFSKEINKYFPKHRLYLFDTFSGLSEFYVGYDKKNGYASTKAGHFSNTTEEEVRNKMKYPENCIFCKGYFPETAEGIKDRFCFVNLDADLYVPTLAGLGWFYPRVEKGGILLIHDFFSLAFQGVREAVKRFSQETGVSYVPIGDSLSVAIKKQE